MGAQLLLGVLSTSFCRQVVVVKLLTLLGKGSGAQLATGTSVVTTGPGQVIVTQPFAELAVCEAHVATGSFTVLLSLQVVARQLLLPLAGSSNTESPTRAG